MGKVSRRGVELQPLHFTEQETFMVHANATLTPRGRLLLARRIVDEGWSIARADEHQGRRNLWLRTLDRFGLGFDS